MEELSGCSLSERARDERDHGALKGWKIKKFSVIGG